MMREPQIYRPLEGRLQVRIDVPFGEGKTVRPWLWEICGDRTRAVWDEDLKRWLVAPEHLARLRDALVEKYGACRVLIDARVSQHTRCDTNCTGAKHDECTCRCGGVNHRGTQSGYTQVGQTTLIRTTDEVATTLRRYVRG